VLARSRIVLSAIGFLLTAQISSAEDRSPGTWITQGDFAQMNVFCRQVWRCVPGQDVLHQSGTRVATTPDEATNGTCSADGGPAGSCNVCLAAPPTVKCEYWIEKQ
jgi:hypothetical protein